MRKELIATLMVAAVLLGGWSPMYAADPTLAGWWKLDDGAGTTAVDASGKSVDGELFGDPVWDTEGIIGGSLLFDGADDYIFIDGHFELPEYTMAVWFRVDEPGQRDILSAYAVGVQHGILLELQAAGTLRFLHRFPLGTGGGNNIYTTTTYDDGVWYHAAFMKSADEIALYVNGELVDSLADNSTFDAGDSFGLAVGVLDDERGADRLFLGAMDDVRVHNRALSQAEVQSIMRGAGYDTAVDPVPAHEAADVPREVVLGWIADDAAVAHDVYFGSVFDDVNDADRADPMGVLVSQGQTATTFDVGLLEFGQTYYWRIDEVNAPPNSVIFKGDIWSFTTEPLGYPIEGIMATSNGTPNADAGPENTVNGSGLDDEDLHSTNSSDMWSATPGDDPLYIQFDFDKIYKLHEMLVWNYNVGFEMVLGFGLKDVTVEYSTDGADWVVLSDVVLAQGTAMEGYAANTTIDFGGVAAQSVRLTVNSGYGMMGQFGLSEVRFLFIPAQAREPQPADEAADVAVSDTVLSWRSGREAVTHEVYLGTDPDALELFDTTSATTLDPGALDLGATYYWRIDEVNEADDISVWEGDLWSFTTQPYIVVDDFESYTDDEGGRIYETWVDGWVNETGSTVGHLDAPFAETTIVRSGSQSMPLFYDNTSVATSEAELMLTQDWATNGIKTLSLMFYGTADNSGQLYVRINDTEVAYDGAADDIKASQWQAWNIDLTALSGLQNVTSLTIGVEGASAAGTLYIDDIRLYPLPGELVVPTEPSADGLVAHLSFDESSGTTAADSSGNDNHGDVVGDAQWVAGKVGGALAFDGVDDMVVVNQNSGLPIYNNGTDNAYSGALWVKGGPQNDMRIFSEGSTSSNTPLLNLGTHNSTSPTGQFAAYIRPDAGTTLNHPLSQAEPFDDTWHHIAWVDDDGTATLYVDGLLDAGDFSYTRGTMALDTTSIGGILRAAPSHWFTGQIDEVRIYSRTLSAGEVLGLAGKTQPIHKPF